MAFVDSLIDHSDDKRVIMVDRRFTVGGHWLESYPFVRLHQASAFYGVASTPLGDRDIQRHGPEAGLHERATSSEICAYYGRLLRDKFLPSGRVSFHPNSEYTGSGAFSSLVSGERNVVTGNPRIVDARYMSPAIPANSPPPFGAGAGVRIVTPNELIRLGAAASQYVIVGAGKTATDTCIWLLENGVDPDAICWVRPREPWMQNRALTQPEPAVFLRMQADMLEAAGNADSAEDLFLRLEEAGIMLRIDRSIMPTMAKTPTLAEWELELLRSIENVVRLGYLKQVETDRMILDGGEVPKAADAVIVHCAASAFTYPPLVPIWGPDAITLQPIRAAFPMFAAAMTGFVEATIADDAMKNALCPPTPFSSTMTDWARMQLMGNRAWNSYRFHEGIMKWADSVRLNPARMSSVAGDTPEFLDAVQRVEKYQEQGMTRLAQIAGVL